MIIKLSLYYLCRIDGAESQMGCCIFNFILLSLGHIIRQNWKFHIIFQVRRILLTPRFTSSTFRTFRFRGCFCNQRHLRPLNFRSPLAGQNWLPAIIALWVLPGAGHFSTYRLRRPTWLFSSNLQIFTTFGGRLGTHIRHLSLTSDSFGWDCVLEGAENTLETSTFREEAAWYVCQVVRELAVRSVTPTLQKVAARFTGALGVLFAFGTATPLFLPLGYDALILKHPVHFSFYKYIFLNSL